MQSNTGEGDFWKPADVVQEILSTDVCDLGPGYLHACLLPEQEIQHAFSVALSRYGPAALTYGHNWGALPYRSALARRLTQTTGVRHYPENLVLTPGTSQALDTLISKVARPGDTVLVESPTYDLALKIFRHRGLRIHAVERDPHGLVPSALEDAIETIRAKGGTPAFCYLIPTFHNPTGALTPPDRRTEILTIARRHTLLLVEDDAYADLYLDGVPPPPSLAALSGFRDVVQLGTFSKSVAPGLRLGWLAASTEFCEGLAARGVAISGGSSNPIPSLALTEMLRSGSYEHHLTTLRIQLAEHRDILVDTLRKALPEDFIVRRPGGGFFTWVTLPGDFREREAVAAARNAGVIVAPGSRFGAATPEIRLAFSAHSPDDIHKAARSLGSAWQKRK
ncbi:aminotransferase class I/II-fold pyridoxal phosphate-dependent enzyme [Streptomyces physcomitrii]|uniref:aminotransferase class I/II-fold pyridoxal phosphate-dependent enzyme n=1 Tax=Streptomyces physcomitrii TaxID=2724184 RepID=UPI0007C7202A